MRPSEAAGDRRSWPAGILGVSEAGRETILRAKAPSKELDMKNTGIGRGVAPGQYRPGPAA